VKDNDKSNIDAAFTRKEEEVNLEGISLRNTSIHDFQVDEGNTIPEKLVIRRLFLPCLSISEDAIMVPM
jgi:hypothetical protein